MKDQPYLTCLYPMADAWNMRLYENLDRYSGALGKVIDLGLWKLTCPVELHTEVIEFSKASAIVKIRKAVWAYMFYCRDTRKLHLWVFDGKAAGIKTAKMVEFVTGDIEKTTEMLSPFVVAQFYSTEAKGWFPYADQDMG